MATRTKVDGVSAQSSARERNSQPRPLSEFQADLDQFLDLPSQRRVLIAILPYGTAYAKKPGDGNQGQDYDVVVLNESGAFCNRQRMDRRQLRRFLVRDGHELRVQKGAIGEVWPSRVAEVRP